MVSVGERIKKLRKSKGITQAEIGNALNLANNTISDWESGKKQLTVEKITNVADFFNVPISYFFEESSESIGEKIKNLRKEHGLKQEDIAERLGLVHSSVSSWERDITKPPFDKLCALADLFNVSVNYFVESESNEIQKTEEKPRTYSRLTAEQSVFFTDLMTKALEMDIEEREKFIDSIKFAVEFFEREKN